MSMTPRAEKVATFDILNCGPRHRFVANGKLVHNSQKLNPQNYGSRPSPTNPLGKRNAARRSMRVPDGYTLVAADSRQVEVRVLGAVCGDTRLLDRYASDPDYSPYLEFGEARYRRVIDKKKDAIEYNSSKEAILACGFGLGPHGYLNRCKQSGIPMTLPGAEETVYFYRDTHEEVVEFWAQCGWALDRIMDGRSGSFGYRSCLRVQGEAIVFPSGRLLRYKDLHWTKRPSRDDPERLEDTMVFYDPLKHFYRKLYGSLVCENIVQGAATDIVQDAGVSLAFGHNLWPILQVHDELAFSIRNEEVSQMLPVIARAMRRSPRWMPWLPVDCEVDVGQDYGVMQEVSV